MSETVIKIENLSKQYRLGLIGTGTLSHDLNRWWHMVRGNEDPYLKIGEINDRSVNGTSKYVWAIKDINLELKKGEVLGIIGKNGAGKSTLLKILSRVTGPTTGVIKVKGRIGSLLEVGTGFHPELTGRENIFLNGSILGMTKLEINRKLEEIIDFSGTGRYINTPVKRYSSGMKVRLAFAVAAHLDPEILVIDEVLAVGDADFQKKAIGKMEEISKSDGRTILFVSHNMAAVRTLCDKAILLIDGKIDMEGSTANVLARYLGGESNQSFVTFKNGSGPECSSFALHEASVSAKGRSVGDPITMDDEINVALIFDLHKTYDTEQINSVLQVKDSQGNYLFVTGANMVMNKDLEDGKYRSITTFPKHFFNSGTFNINVNFVKNRRVVLQIPDILTFTVVNKKNEAGEWLGTSKGALKPIIPWSIDIYE